MEQRLLVDDDSWINNEPKRRLKGVSHTLNSLGSSRNGACSGGLLLNTIHLFYSLPGSFPASRFRLDLHQTSCIC